MFTEGELGSVEGMLAPCPSWITLITQRHCWDIVSLQRRHISTPQKVKCTCSQRLARTPHGCKFRPPGKELLWEATCAPICTCWRPWSSKWNNWECFWLISISPQTAWFSWLCSVLSMDSCGNFFYFFIYFFLHPFRRLNIGHGMVMENSCLQFAVFLWRFHPFGEFA